MRGDLGLALMLTGLVTWAAAGPSSHRWVVVVGAPGDPRVMRQTATLNRDAAALRERDVIVEHITPDAARRDRPELGLSPRAAFEVLLVGKDGGVKLRREAPVAVSEIAALIDAMPMRREEMRRESGAPRG
jgi:hypothetical protein